MKPPLVPGSSLKAAAGRLGTQGRLAVGAIVVAAVVLAVSARGVVRAFLAPFPAAVTVAADGPLDQSARLQGLVAQIDGRSMFFVPGPPPPPAAPVIAQAEPAAPPPPPPPAKYGGPTPIAMMNGTVWFAGDIKLKEGDKNDDIRVVRLEPPWAAVLEWKGVEFTVNLFEHDSVVLKQRTPTASKPAATPEPAPTTEPPSEADPVKAERSPSSPSPEGEPKAVAPSQPVDPGNRVAKERP
jgi:hypothetical protein